jgi:DNA-binding MurR/RpiR family transcriptional regulator
MKGHGQKFTRKMHHAVSALLQSPTVEAAAGLCGVSESTLSRWIKRSDFQDVYTQARRELVQRSLSSLQTASVEALDALKRNLVCGLPAIEVRAASALLDQSLRATELLGIEARLDALECAVKSQAEHG